MTEREKFEKWWYETWHGCISDQDVAWLVWQAALSAAPTQPEVEPVYQARAFDREGWTDMDEDGFLECKDAGCQSRILYTRPPAPNDELRARAVALCDWLDEDWNADAETDKFVVNLRSALGKKEGE